MVDVRGTNPQVRRAKEASPANAEILGESTVASRSNQPERSREKTNSGTRSKSAGEVLGRDKLRFLLEISPVRGVIGKPRTEVLGKRGV